MLNMPNAISMFAGAGSAIAMPVLNSVELIDKPSFHAMREPKRCCKMPRVSIM
jgi:hypothetical protein